LRILQVKIFGFGEAYKDRIVSFFKDEPIVGGFINSFYLIIIGFLFMNFRNKNFIFIFSIIFLIAIFATGERSNSIKVLASLSIFYIFLKEYKFKKKLTLLISMSVYYPFLF
jgi:O-antigen ligase